MKPIQNILLFTVLIISISFSGTDVSGTYDEDVAWTLDGSPYTLVGSVNIYGATLTIEPNVTVDLQAYDISVYSYSNNTNSRPASLYADNVTFTSSSSLYSQIIFDSSYYNITEYPAGGVLSNCTFENINFQFEDYNLYTFFLYNKLNSFLYSRLH